jgi:hypothetical protein
MDALRFIFCLILLFASFVGIALIYESCSDDRHQEVNTEVIESVETNIDTLLVYTSKNNHKIYRLIYDIPNSAGNVWVIFAEDSTGTITDLMK